MSLCARHCSKHCAYIRSFNPKHTHFTGEKTGTERLVGTLPEVTQVFGGGAKIQSQSPCSLALWSPCFSDCHCHRIMFIVFSLAFVTSSSQMSAYLGSQCHFFCTPAPCPSSHARYYSHSTSPLSCHWPSSFLRWILSCEMPFSPTTAH